MARYKLTIEYDGTRYSGWQKQDNAASVQEVVEFAANRINGEDTRVFGAGRTDTGVHALGQVAHVDMAREWQTDKLTDALNFHLKNNRVAILRIDAVDEEFHARFSAKKRHYRYLILNRRAPLTVDTNRLWRVSRRLDETRMAEAGALLIGRHDFTTFRATKCQAASPIKTLDVLTVTRRDQLVEIEVASRSFLHNQVRSIAGSLRLVGEGKWSVDDMAEALAAKDRRACGPVAPAHGLYLTQVDY